MRQIFISDDDRLIGLAWLLLLFIQEISFPVSFRRLIQIFKMQTAVARSFGLNKVSTTRVRFHLLLNLSTDFCVFAVARHYALPVHSPGAHSVLRLS
jgi:hypothetical protein